MGGYEGRILAGNLGLGLIRLSRCRGEEIGSAGIEKDFSVFIQSTLESGS